jgi:hypothetical protein
MTRRFPAPWRADKMPGGYVVRDANGQALVYVYSRENEAEALQSKGADGRRGAEGRVKRREAAGTVEARGLMAECEKQDSELDDLSAAVADST